MITFLNSMLVERIDEDKDGYVTVEEMKKWIKHAQKKWIYDDVDRQWKTHDLDEDGEVSWEEYKKATYGYIMGMPVCAWKGWYTVLILSLYSNFSLQMTLTLKMATATSRWWLVMRGDSKWQTLIAIWKQTRRSLQLFSTQRNMTTWKILLCWWVAQCDGIPLPETFLSLLWLLLFLLQETMEDIDKNGDGLIDLDEYIGEIL